MLRKLITYTSTFFAILTFTATSVFSGSDDWKASAWFLKMQDRELFGDKVQADVNVDMNMESIADRYRALKEKNG